MKQKGEGRRERRKKQIGFDFIPKATTPEFINMVRFPCLWAVIQIGSKMYHRGYHNIFKRGECCIG
jgi:hypothetical protein